MQSAALSVLGEDWRETLPATKSIISVSAESPHRYLFQIFNDLINMSQPALTNFFSQPKRATRSSKAAKILDIPQGTVENEAPSKRATRRPNSKVEKVIVIEKTEAQSKPEKETPILKEVIVNKESLKEEESREVNANTKGVKDDVQSEAKAAPRRGRKKVIKDVEPSQPDDCPSPAKRNKAASRKVTAVEETLEVCKKLKPEEVKKQLQGTKKLTDLKEKLKEIEKTSESVKEKKQKTIAAAKKVAEDKAKTDYEKSPAYIQYHSLSLKDDGTLPLPFSYKFLEEVYRCTEQISTMLHNRHETITFEKLKVAVQQMLRKNFNVSYLKQIKTVFPEAYRLVGISEENIRMLILLHSGTPGRR